MGSALPYGSRGVLSYFCSAGQIKNHHGARHFPLPRPSILIITPLCLRALSPNDHTSCDVVVSATEEEVVGASDDDDDNDDNEHDDDGDEDDNAAVAADMEDDERHCCQHI